MFGTQQLRLGPGQARLGWTRPDRGAPGPSLSCWVPNIDFSYKKNYFGTPNINICCPTMEAGTRPGAPRSGRVQPRRAWPGPSLHCWAANIDFGYTKSIFGHQKSIFEYQKTFRKSSKCFWIEKSILQDRNSSKCFWKRVQVPGLITLEN